MSYKALARRLRPKTFDGIIGQDHVVTPLANAVMSAKIHHGYLFAGTRGIGKTTAARIFARAVNCSEGTPPDPCNECTICGEIIAGTSTDVLEIDGASNTGIDDVRRLRETAVYVPSKGRFRVYIIDEVHMLSRQAFNGLLKILEEPPLHLIFIFATTEPYRIPETVLSRMIRFDFRLIPENKILEHLRTVCGKEHIQYDEPSLTHIASVAAGSIRDSLSILEQCALTTEGSLAYDKVLEILGYPEVSGVIRLGSAVVEGNAGEAISILRNIYGGGADLKNLYATFLAFFRKVALYSFTENPAVLSGGAEQERNAVVDVSGRLTKKESLFLFDVIVKSERDVLMSEFPLAGFEAMLLRAISFRELMSVSAILSGEGGREGIHKASGKEKELSPDVTVTASVREDVPGGRDAGVAAEGSAGKGQEAGKFWYEFLDKVTKRKKFVLKGLLENMRGGFDGENFYIRCEFEALLDKLQEADKWNIIEDATREIFGKPVNIILQKDEHGIIENAGSTTDREDMENKVLSDPVVIELLREFPGSRIADISRIDPKKRSGDERSAGPVGGFSSEMEGVSPDMLDGENEEDLREEHE